MANVKISELSPLVTVQDADVLPIVDNAVTKKVTAAILRSYTQGNSVLLTGAQTVAGIKTFTAQLASSVATGTAPFSVASTTKVTNLNADLLDGLSSADFQATLSGTGIVKSTAGTISYLTDNSTNWNTAFNERISTLTTTGSSGAATLSSNTLNIPNYTLSGLGGVPYTGATADVNLGTHSLTASDLVINHASGSGVAASITKGGAGEALTVVKSSGSGNAASITGGTTLISELNLTTDLADAYIASAATWNAKQNAITLTTTGTSGAATLVGSTLNIPNYADTDTGITSLNGLTALTQTFAVGTSGTDFGISSATSTHTFNLPTASAANRGALSSADWTTFNNKQNALTNPVTGTGTTNYIPKFTGASALGNSLFQEGTSAIGLSVTPSAWDGSKAMQYGTLASISAYSNLTNDICFNAYYDGADWKYIQTGREALRYRQLYGTNGGHFWDTAGSGTAGNAVTFTQAMTLTASGQLGIGTTSPAEKLQVNGNIITDWGSRRIGMQYLDGSVYQFGMSFASSPNRFVNFDAFSDDSDGAFRFRTGTVGTPSEKVRITNTGSVGIGTTTPAYTLDVNGTARVKTTSLNGLVIETNDVTTLKLTSNSGVSKNWGFATTNLAINDFGIYQSTSTGGDPISAGTAKLYFDGSGAAKFSAGVAISGATAPASGIEFPSTQVASASANNLDDYEEGTWTMGVSFGGASVGVTYSSNTGTYTKIGRQVTVNGFVRLTSKGSSTGNASITGLPFTIGNVSANYSAPALTFSGITFINQFQGEGGIGQTEILLQEITSLGVLSAITDADFAISSYILISFTYFV
jgi:hypothetical protein